MYFLSGFCQPILEKVRVQRLPTSQGISLLESKFQLLMSYCTHICVYMLLKAEGKRLVFNYFSLSLSVYVSLSWVLNAMFAVFNNYFSVQKHPIVDRLVYIRTLLEKIKPLVVTR